MRILHYVSGLDAASGGLSRAVLNQCLATQSSQLEVHLAFSDSGSELAPGVADLQEHGVHICACNRSQLLARLPRLVLECDVVHLHGIWPPPCLWLAWLARRARRPLVVTSHGMLEPWALAYRRWKKHLALWLGVRGMLDSATVIQATAESEAINLRRLGLTRPIAIIPNSVSIPEFSAPMTGQGSGRIILFLSRIHPVKGVLELIAAVKSQEERLRDGHWRVVIAGPDSDGHWAAVEREATRLAVRDMVEYVGPVDGQQKWDLYRSATLFVLPTYSENFGLVIAEALGCGVPCITTHGAPWKELSTNGCGWWHPIGQDHLSSALAEAIETSPDTLRAMGQRGIDIVRQRYAISSHREDFHAMYDWVAHGGPEPKCFFPYDGARPLSAEEVTPSGESFTR